MVTVPRVLVRRPRSGAAVMRSRLVGDPGGTATVLVGPAGSGKSVLAGQIADAVGGRLAWTRLAPGWSTPDLLPVLIGAALGVETEASDDPNVVADAVLEWLEAEPTCLVIDDLHEAEGDVESVLAEILGFLPSDATVVIASRRRPTVLIGRTDPAILRVLEGDELAFDRDELGELLGGDAEAAAALDATGGWASLAAAFADHGGGQNSADAVLAAALAPEALGDGAAVARTLAALPYADAGLLASLGHDLDAAERLADHSSLVSVVDARWLLHATARDHLLPTIPDDELAATRRTAGLHLADEDAPTAVELLIAAGAPEDAGDVLAARASEIGAARATRWLYQLPAEVRRRLPPLLTDGRATVNVDLAMESARRQVDDATDNRTRREGLAGLGSLLLANAELVEAADTLESAMRLADDDHGFRELVGEQLATTRWLAGDRVGAGALLDDLAPTMWTAYRRAVLGALAGDAAATAAAAGEATALEPDPDGTRAPALAASGLAALVSGDRAAAADHAAAAYAEASSVMGRDLAVAGPMHAWALLAAGDVDGAEAVAEQLDRNVARHDQVARVHSAHIKLAALQARGDDDGGRAERRVADLGGLGLTPVLDLITLLRGEEATPAGSGLVVHLSGAFTVAVDGTVLDSSAWKSKKARDVCALVCNAGELGLRREQVIESIWEGRDPQKGRTLLRTALTEIRRVLEPRRGTGQESRFVATSEDRVIVRGTTDLRQAASLRHDQPAAAFALIAAGPAADGPDTEWFDELGGEVERLRTELAARVAPDVIVDDEVRIAAYEVLITAEPWQREHFQELAALHRHRGDEHAAADVDRRWFADD